MLDGAEWDWPDAVETRIRIKKTKRKCRNLFLRESIILTHCIPREPTCITLLEATFRERTYSSERFPLYHQTPVVQG